MITDNQFIPGEIETADYMPSWLYGPYFWEQRKPWFHRRFIPAMLRDSRVTFGLKLIKGPIISSTSFEVECDQQEVVDYIEKLLDRFWNQSAVVALRALEWGFSGSEAIYEEGTDGMIYFSHLKALASYDCRVWTTEGRKTAIRVRDPKDSSQGVIWLYGPKGFWHIHQREEHRWYGISRLLNAYPAWYDKHKNGGCRDSLSLFFYKYALTGHVVKYPPRQRKMPDGTMLDPKQEAERIANYTRTGATIVIPNERDGDGNPLWEIEYAQNTASGSELMEYYRMLDKQIFEGLGIPEELIEAGETGSGYAGRRVPAQSFFSLLQELGEILMTDVDEQIVRPLIDWNFGPDVQYYIKMLPLAGGDIEEDPQETLGEEEVSSDKPEGKPETNKYQ